MKMMNFRAFSINKGLQIFWRRHEYRIVDRTAQSEKTAPALETYANGFTLIEVLIAMAIFSVGILAVGAMQISSTNGSTSARIYTESSVWAQDTVEMLMQLPFGDPQLATGNHPSATIPNTNNYTVGYDVWDNAGGAIGGASTPMLNGKTPSPGTKIIEVTVIGRDNQASTLAFVRSEDL